MAFTFYKLLLFFFFDHCYYVTFIKLSYICLFIYLFISILSIIIRINLPHQILVAHLQEEEQVSHLKFWSLLFTHHSSVSPSFQIPRQFKISNSIKQKTKAYNTSAYHLHAILKKKNVLLLLLAKPSSAIIS